MSDNGAPEALLAAARGAAYGLLAAGWRYPDAELLTLLGEPARWDDWPATLATLDPAAARALETVASYWLHGAGGAGHAGSAHLDLLRHTYVTLVGHAVRGTCPPYELEYDRGEIYQQAAGLADLGGFYAAFGLELARGAAERADHVSVQCEFMAVLCAKESNARATGNGNGSDTCADAQRTFLRDHLGRWLPAFAHRVQQADADGFYATLAAFASAFIDGECRRFEIPLGPPLLQLRAVDPVKDVEINCDGAETCGAGGGEPLVQLGLAVGTD
ncbi:MAG: molecular chaperone TorD family protein [Planctomycetes bacterium]|nr:molecular chaperone TorD family protein [Planctomycetota bacterium]